MSFATRAKSTPSASFTFFAWIFKISSLPLTSGRSITTCLSKRPGRSKALSKTSGRFVAAMTIIPLWTSKPSISTSSELSVCSRSSLPFPLPTPRLRPTASISSMKTRHGAFFLAWSNMSRTRAAPTPTNISTKSEPLIEKNGTSASPATARASSVLPVPGGPTISTPLGIFAPMSLKRLGFFKNSTISATSSFDSSQPATSAKVVLFSSGEIRRARLLPKSNAPFVPPLICRAKKIYNTPITSRMGRTLISMLPQNVLAGSSLISHGAEGSEIFL